MKESPLFVRTYDLMLWLIPHLQKFPRAYRFGLAERIQRHCLDFQDAITAAGKSRGAERRVLLHRADIQLEQLRLWLRMSVDLELLSLRRYEHVMRLTNEVGRLLGAWIKNS